jgi:hypothetical protein
MMAKQSVYIKHRSLGYYFKILKLYLVQNFLIRSTQSLLLPTLTCALCLVEEISDRAGAGVPAAHHGTLVPTRGRKLLLALLVNCNM